ncbi:hypothetical protein LOC67_08865 [Stieleria sp. JC731]|uniref:hypothetical protein n=1 Tax=Pirellulaceae TaxID=2691357 RepID=UPI001E53C486|nr:hypothetical protein [Stieleria sp. JC731]MCC9600672.1 hypothetical protein [Stieleria sp. JC731]
MKLDLRRALMLCPVMLLATCLAGCKKATTPDESSVTASTSEPASTDQADAETTPSPAISPSAPPPASDAETAPEPLEALPDGEAEDGGYTIAQVMQLAHDNKLYRELFSEPADPEVVQRLKTLYADLPKREPPKGDPEQWKERSQALVDAVDAIESGDEKGVAMLKRAVNCSSCHGRHRES